MNFPETVDIINKLVTTGAIITGGVWAYFNFIKGRIYRPRLQVEVSGSVILIEERMYIKVLAKLHNVGNSVVLLEQKGTGLRVFGEECDNHAATIRNINWKHLATYPVFENHGWIEGKETISHEQLLVVPADKYPVFCLKLRVVSNKISWSHSSIVMPIAKEK